MSLTGDITLKERLKVAAPGIPVLLAIVIFWTFGYLGLWQRLQIDLDGKIIARQDFPPLPTTHGPTTVYRLQQADGSIHEYTATRGDASLPRTIPVGAMLTKRQWELFYLVNGTRVDDFPLRASVIFLIFGSWCVVATVIWLVRERLQERRAKAASR